MKDNAGAVPNRSSTPQEYLPFMDGLRAIAVTAVVLFHAKIPQFAGGFLGVDIFFVISGFLILGIVVRALEANSFSVVDFLSKRALRLFPPLAIVIACTAIGTLFFPVLPPESREITSAARWAAFFSANFYFAADQGYFATSAESKPLLHIWSLAVEEQFYFTVAAIAAILSMMSIRGVGGIAKGLGIGLMLLSAVLWAASFRTWSGNAFYLLPWRAWEFLIGGLGFYTSRTKVFGSTAAWLAAIAVLAVIGLIDSEQFILGALVVAPATAVVLSGCTTGAPKLVKILSFPAMRAIGKVSYSWYLWHWPVIFFFRTTNLGRPELAMDILGAAVSLALAVLTFILIEKPAAEFRRRKRPVARQAGAFAFCVSCLVLATFIAQGAGHAFAKANADLNREYRRATKYTERRLSEESYHEGAIYSIGPREPSVVVWGDSHARSLRSMLAELSGNTGVSGRLYWSPQCLPFDDLNAQLPSGYEESCAEIRARAISGLLATGGVILSAFWIERSSDPGFNDRITLTIERLASRGLRVLLVGQVPTYPIKAADCIYRAKKTGISLTECNGKGSDIRAQKVLALFNSIAGRFRNVRVIDPYLAFCSATCSPYFEDQVLVTDNHHLNSAGAELLYDRFRTEFVWVAGSIPKSVSPESGSADTGGPN